MPLNTGTMTLADLQAITTPVGLLDATVQQQIADTLQRELDIHNRVLADAVGSVAEITSDNLRQAGGTSSGDMIIADEHSRAPTQKPATGGTVGFPKDLFQTAIGWTQRYLNKATPAGLVTVQTNIRRAHARRVLRQMKVALYSATNVTTTDYTERNAITLPVKRFYNADSWDIPIGPNGEVYTGSSHTHYTAEASLSAAGLLAAVNNVAEHNTGSMIQVAIAAADEAAVRALTGFTAYVDSRVQLGTGQVATQRLDNTNPGNRAIGVFGIAEVWVKPWAIASYAVIYDMAAPEKPLVLRTPNGQQPMLMRVAENNAFPLIAQFYESEFGFGAYGRGAGAVHYWGGGNTTYAEPTIP